MGALRAEHSAAQAARGGARCRRRLRRQAIPLCRRGRDHLGRAQGRAADQMGLRAQRRLHLRRARPRSRHRGRTCARRERKIPRRCSVNTLANMGGYLSTFGPNIPTNLYGPLLAGVYTTPAIYCEVKVVFTNTVPVDAYRGAGRPEATFVLERLVDVAASEMGIDRVEIRRRNMIPKEAYPYQTPVHGAVRHRRSRWAASTRRAGRCRLGRFRARARRRRPASGKLRGIGYSHLCRGLRPGALAHRRPARRARRPLRKRHRARASDRPGHGADRHAQSRPGPRDDLCADRLARSSACRSRTSTSCSATPTRCSSAWAPMARARWWSAAPRCRRPPTRSSLKGKKIAAHLLEAASRTSHSRPGEFSVAGHRPQEDVRGDRGRRLCAAQLSARSAGAGPGGAGLLRSGQLHLSRRRPHRRGGDRSRDRHRRRWSTTRRSTTSAPSSTR